MSRFLSEPATEKTSHVFSVPKLGLHIGSSSMQGWRDTMEDAELIQTQLPLLPSGSCFGIFDGHGGDFIAKAVAQEILNQITSTEEYKKFASNDGANPRTLVEAISKGFLTTDKMLQDAPDLAGKADEVGATGLLVFLTDTHIISANIGDSRCILSNTQAKNPIQMSLDHKPDHEFEKLRIMAAGGTVFRGRVCGGVAVSRSFGDFWFKRNEEKPAHEQLVIAEPCVNVQQRDLMKDEFLVLCCDGIYDVMSNEQVQRYVREKLRQKSPNEVAELLMDECLNKGSRDNMSVIIVVFSNQSKDNKKRGGFFSR